MNVSDIIRALLDKLDHIENGDAADVLSPANADPEKQDKMMPPLQQKQELLKKVVGVDSEYDDEPDYEKCDNDDEYHSELEKMKKNAGIIVLSDDDPL